MKREEELVLLAKQMNDLSEVLLGCREGNYVDLINKAIDLKLKAQNVEIQNNFRKIADAISELKELSDEIISGT